MKQAFVTYAVVVQLLAILLLQCYPIAPHLGRKVSMPQCRGNHAECGCAPERIAAHTCCCYHGKPACCDKEKHGDAERVARQDGDHSSRNLYAAPCGSSTKFITASLEKLKFLRPEALLQVPSGDFVSHSPAGPETATSRYAEPPDPPPRLTLPA